MTILKHSRCQPNAPCNLDGYCPPLPCSNCPGPVLSDITQTPISDVEQMYIKVNLQYTTKDGTKWAWNNIIDRRQLKQYRKECKKQGWRVLSVRRHKHR